MGGFDLSALAPEHRVIVEEEIARCRFPFERLTVTMPVHFSDLSRYGAAAQATQGGHLHVHEGDAVGHVLADARGAVWGLYWLPPHDKVEVEQSLPRAEAGRTFIYEAAHAVDYRYMTDEERHAVLVALHGGELPEGHSDWWEEGGEYDYVDWAGEAWMIVFAVSFSDYPAEFGRFSHLSPETMLLAVDAAQRILRPEPEPKPEPEPDPLDEVDDALDELDEILEPEPRRPRWKERLCRRLCQ